jgi:orotate phosphoribosyltransferase
MTGHRDILAQLPARRGHFALESGHHGELWLDLEALCVDPIALQPVAAELASRIAAFEVEAVCGPLNEGAFLALMVALKLALPFTYAVPYARGDSVALFPIGYRIPRPLRTVVRNKRVAILNDVIGAGSAVRGTLADLRDASAIPVVVAAIGAAGDAASQLAAEYGVALEVLATWPNTIWTPAECPLCASGVPLS